MESPRRICGDVRRVVVTEEQRYGPRWLRVNDDDELCSELIKVVDFSCTNKYNMCTFMKNIVSHELYTTETGASIPGG